MTFDLPHLTQDNGHLHIENVDAMELVQEYGTPLYVYSKSRLIQNYQRLKTSFANAGSPIHVNYAIKCNSNLALLHLLREAGCGADVSSLAEIDLARHAGFEPEKIIYSGNNNPDEELAHALKYVDNINLDAVSILPRLLKLGMPKVLSFRINPNIGTGSNDSTTFAGKASKFGIDAEAALYGYQMAKKAGVQKFGIHMMTASGVLDNEHFKNVSTELFSIAEMIAQKAGIEFEFIDIGGGFGIPYKPEDEPLDMDYVAQTVHDIYQDYISRGTIGKPRLECEPGRYIVGDIGMLLTRIHCIKETNFSLAGTDGGLSTLLRAAMYGGSYHHMVIANKMDQSPEKTYRVCGRICENADMDVFPREFPKLEEGDVIGTYNAGAYGFTMTMVFNNQPRPAEVLIDGNQHHLIRKRETFDDLIRPMIVPKDTHEA
jgi:diaminopimelate decarboxylase